MKWNVMIYLAGDNNLSPEMVWALKEMQNSAAGSDSTVKVHFDPLGDRIPIQRYNLKQIKKKRALLYECVTPFPTPTDAHELEKIHQYFNRGIAKTLLHSHHRLEPENTGNPTALAAFVWWATKRPPAADRKNMLIVSGHGCGFANDFLLRDDSPRDSLTIKELAKVLAVAKARLKRERIDILGMDSCMMSTAEVYYEVRKSVRCLVAAEGFVANAGWPYQYILCNLTGTPAETASKIVSDYIKFLFEYAIGGQSADLSACDVTLWRRLKKAVRNLKDALSEALDHPLFLDAVVLAHWRAQSYQSDQTVDLVDFARKLKKEVGKIHDEAGRFNYLPKGGTKSGKQFDPVALKIKINEACDTVVKVLLGDGKKGKPIVLKSGYVGPAFQHSYGLSVYFPWSDESIIEDYKKLEFAKDTGWDRFLTDYVQKTRCPWRSGFAAVGKGFLNTVMNPPPGRSGKYLTGMALSPEEHSARVSPPSNRVTPPSNKGAFPCVSMKNPPIKWRLCSILGGMQTRSGKLLKEQVEKNERGD